MTRMTIESPARRRASGHAARTLSAAMAVLLAVVALPALTALGALPGSSLPAALASTRPAAPAVAAGDAATAAPAGAAAVAPAALPAAAPADDRAGLRKARLETTIARLLGPAFSSSSEALSDGASSIAFSDDGDFALVGSDEGDPDPEGPDITPGAAFLLHWNGSGWSSLMLSDETVSQNCSGNECGYPDWDSGDLFGYSVALSADGEYAVVGAPGAYGESEGYGAAFVYRIGLNSDTPKATLTSLLGANTNYGARFGASVAVTDQASGGAADDPEVVVGAPRTTYYYSYTSIGGDGTDNYVGSNSGALFVYDDPALLNYGNGNLAANIYGTGLDDPSSAAAGEQLGTSVAIDSSGGLIVAGAPQYGTGDPPSANGAVYAFAGQSGSPQLEASGSAPGDMLGQSVAVTPSGSEVAAGEPMASTGESPAPAGAVQVYNPATSWSSVAVSAASPVDGEAFGTSVALSDDGATLVVGAPYDDFYTRSSAYHESTTDATPGYAYVETASGGSFASPSEQVLNPLGENGDYFGAAVGLAGDDTVAAAGATNDYSLNGAYGYNGFEPGNSVFYGTPTTLVPQVQSLSPSSGAASPGQGGTVTIYGSGFTGASAVDFGTHPSSSVTVLDDSVVEATPPVEGAGTVDVTVVAPGGTSATSPADEYTYEVTPAVTGVSPSSGADDAETPITISGSGFTGATEVDLDCVVDTSGCETDDNPYDRFYAGQFTLVSDGEITLEAPDDDDLEISGGITFDVVVIGPGGSSPTSSADEFSLVAPSVPVVTSVTPSTGPADEENPITIEGTGFAGATEVDFDCVSIAAGCEPSDNPYDDFLSGDGEFTVVSDGEITLDAPDESDLGIDSGGVFDVVVIGPAGSSTTSSADEYRLAPDVTGLFPVSSPPLYDAGGWTVDVDGAGFSDATNVFFGSVAAESFAVSDDDDIEAVAPPGAGTVDITVTTPYGTSQTSADDQVSYAAPPSLASVSPAIVSPSGGTEVTVTGSGFLALPSSGGAVWLIGYNFIPIEVDAADYDVTSDTSMTVDVPPLPRGSFSDVGALVVSADGTFPSGADSSDALEVSDELTYGAVVDGLSPAAGPTGGGGLVVIEGYGLADAEQVDFGSTPAPAFEVVSDDELEATAPAGEAGVADLEVLTATGESSTLVPGENVYYYLDPPTVGSVEPPTAAPGDTVTISGSGFAATTRVDFAGAAAGDLAASFSVLSDDELQAVVPSGSGTVDVLVSNPGGTSAATSADQFVFDQPTSGPAASGGGSGGGSGESPGSGGAGAPVAGPSGAAGASPSTPARGGSTGSGAPVPPGGAGSASGAAGGVTLLAKLVRVTGAATLRIGIPAGEATLSVRLRCSSAHACAGSAVLVMQASTVRRNDARPLVLASTTFRLAAHGSGLVGWRLAPSALRLVRALIASGHGVLLLDLRSGRQAATEALVLRSRLAA